MREIQRVQKKFLLVFSFFFTLLFCSVSYAAQENNNNTLERFESLIASHQGKVIYLDFWASWCGPCRKSFPWMNTMQEVHKQQGFVIISVNVDNEKASAEQFLTEVPANFSVFYDPKGKVARKFKLRGMPSSYLIDRSGKVVSAHVGFSGSKRIKYEQDIKNLMNSKS
jgi:thiol-disulfide isomerase/thioredoxin